MRIYFTSANNVGFEHPSANLAYWDSTTGEITAVHPNVDYDLGAGRITRLNDGRIAVSGPRWNHYVGDITVWGDYFSGDYTLEPLDTDAIVYILDPELQNPEVVLTEPLEGTAAADAMGVAWPGGEFGLPDINFDGSPSMVHENSNGNLVIIGNRVVPWSLEDWSEGEDVHEYSPDGATVVSRAVPRSGIYTDPGDDKYTATYPMFSAHDPVRDISYIYHDYGSVIRYNHATGESDFAFQVFAWCQTLWGGTQDPASEGIIRLDRGPASSSSRYGHIYEHDLWRSRKLVSMDVDPTTGYLWALVDAYWPDGIRYLVDGADFPAGATDYDYYDSGDLAFYSIRSKYQLICLDPALFRYLPIRGFSEEEFHKYARPYPPHQPLWGEYRRGGPPQRQAEVEVFDLFTEPLTTYLIFPGTPYEDTRAIFHGPAALKIHPQGGKAYISRGVVGETLGDGQLNPCHAVFEVDLGTGAQTEVFRDERRSTDPEFESYLLGMSIQHLAIDPSGTLITGNFQGARTRFF